MSDWSKDSNVTKKKIYGAGTILALIISIHGIIAFIIANSVIDNFFISITISAIVYFIAMGFSIKIAKKLSKI